MPETNNQPQNPSATTSPATTLKHSAFDPAYSAQIASGDNFPLDDTVAGRLFLSASLAGWYAANDLTWNVRRAAAKALCVAAPVSLMLILNQSEDSDFTYIPEGKAPNGEQLSHKDAEEELKGDLVKLLDSNGDGTLQPIEIAKGLGIAAGALFVGGKINAIGDRLLEKGLSKLGFSRPGTVHGLIEGAVLFAVLEYQARNKKQGNK